MNVLGRLALLFVVVPIVELLLQLVEGVDLWISEPDLGMVVL